MKEIHPLSGVVAWFLVVLALIVAGVSVANVAPPREVVLTPTTSVVPDEWRMERQAVTFDGMIRDRGGLTVQDMYRRR